MQAKFPSLTLLKTDAFNSFAAIFYLLRFELENGKIKIQN
jgi:hypothetical protein